MLKACGVDVFMYMQFYLAGTLHSSASDMVSQLGSVFGGSSPRSRTSEKTSSLVLGEVVVGDVNPLERAVKESRKNYEKVVLAQETVNGVKMEGIDTNLAVMKVKKKKANKVTTVFINVQKIARR